MSSIKHLLASEFESLRTDIITAYETSGMMASGNWGTSVQVMELPNGFSLIADSYILGRKPGKQPPSEAIEQWLKAKGIAAGIEKTISISSLAYLIARKIGREGWQPEQNFIDNIITPQRIQQIINNIGTVALNGFTKQLIDYLKNIAL